MPTTEIGKELRKLRIVEEERLIDMAKRLDKSASFVSAVETGSKAPPVGFENLVVTAYGLAHEVAHHFFLAADRSRKAFTIQPSSDLGKEAIGLMARRMNSKMDGLSAEQLSKIISILKKGESNSE
ncbi:MAG: XRE family transcriptional regulator [Roseibium sp.]